MEEKITCQAVIEGMNGEYFSSPIFEDEGGAGENEILKSAHSKAVGWITEHLRRSEFDSTKYAAIITRNYEGGLIQSESKYDYYEW